MIEFCKYWIVGFSVVVFFSSCVSHKAKYRGSWAYSDKVDQAYYTVYLIGDAGNVAKGESSNVLDHLKIELDNADSNSAVVWLGDNIYPVGLAPEGSPYYSLGRHRLLAQLNTMTNHKGQKFFVPGNHDWYTYGRVGLRRQELLIDSFLLNTPNPNNQLNYFLPDKGCGDPQVVELNDSMGLLLMDSHWFLNDKVKRGDQSVCQVSNHKQFLDQLKEEVDSNKDKSLIVASHHPPYTYSRHGGKFSFKDYVFPLTQKIDWLYIPLPFPGFSFNKLRIRLSEQDMFHPVYIDYRNSINSILDQKGRSIVASGHEHTLQYIESHNQYYIVSGSGSKTNKVGLGKGSQFSIGEKGYVKIIFESAKEALVQFIIPGQFEGQSNVAFEKRISLE